MATARVPILTFTRSARARVGVLDRRLPAQHGRLRAAGHRTVELGYVAARVRQGLDLPPAAVVLTFYDGDRSVRNTPSRCFRRTADGRRLPDGGPPVAGGDRLPSFEASMLSWAEIREMQRAGIAFGAHTLTHLT
jgi:hypothetical protein